MNSRQVKPPDAESKRTFVYSGHIRMKILAASFLLLFLISGTSHSRELTVKRNAREYRVEATLDKYPLVIGDNHIDIKITDRSGKPVTDAKVLVNYYMPPMPRMVPMNYKTKANSESEKYEAKMNIIMAGPWYIRIIIRHAGKIATTRFNVDAQ